MFLVVRPPLGQGRSGIDGGVQSSDAWGVVNAFELGLYTGCLRHIAAGQVFFIQARKKVA